MNENEQENPAVSKLREAFDTARNAILEGSALAVQVQELQGIVNTLRSETTLLQLDLEYIRNRNKELDEQVTEVRRQRDSAFGNLSIQQERADRAEGQCNYLQNQVNNMTRLYDAEVTRSTDLIRERDDAMVMALEYETKFKEATAKLARVELVLGDIFNARVVPIQEVVEEANRPKPHYVDQPRDEVGKFQPIEEPKPQTYGSDSQGSF